MLVHSYKHYLASLEQKTDTGIIGKALFIAGILTLITVGIVSSLLYFENQKEAPIRKQAAYLQNARNTLSSMNQSTGEILTSFQVAGAKVRLVDNLKESSAAAGGFFVSLDDIERSLSSVELTGKNAQNTKAAFQSDTPPQNLSGINDRIIAFLDNSQKSLEAIYQEQSFVKDVLYASGPGFYLPVLTDETIWKQGNKDAIVNYYKDVKLQADDTLKSLSRLTPPEVYKSYYDTQTAYLTLLVNVSDRIINTLSLADSLNPDEATQVEKAYQQLISAKKENEKLSETLLNEKIKIFDVTRNQQKFVQIKGEEDSLIADLNAKYTGLPPTKIDKLPLPPEIKSIFTN